MKTTRIFYLFFHLDIIKVKKPSLLCANPSGIDSSEFFVNPDQKNHEKFVKDDIERIVRTKFVFHQSIIFISFRKLVNWLLV